MNKPRPASNRMYTGAHMQTRSALSLITITSSLVALAIPFASAQTMLRPGATGVRLLTTSSSSSSAMSSSTSSTSSSSSSSTMSKLLLSSSSSAATSSTQKFVLKSSSSSAASSKWWADASSTSSSSVAPKGQYLAEYCQAINNLYSMSGMVKPDDINATKFNMSVDMLAKANALCGAMEFPKSSSSQSSMSSWKGQSMPNVNDCKLIGPQNSTLPGPKMCQYICNLKLTIKPCTK